MCYNVFTTNNLTTQGNNKMTFTKKEIEVMNILASHIEGEFLTDDGVEPNPDGFFVISGPKKAVDQDWGKTGLDLKIYRGVIASLIKKDVITTDSWSWDLNRATGKFREVFAIALTLNGFDNWDCEFNRADH